MGLKTWLQNKALRLAWSGLEDRMTWIRRWAPVIGSLVLVASVGLRLAGKNEAAGAIEGLGSVLGLTSQSSISVAEIAAATAAGTGVVIKIVSEVRKAMAAADTVSTSGR